jgi:hypothetical protein
MQFAAPQPSVVPSPVLCVGRAVDVSPSQLADELAGGSIDLRHVSLTGYSLGLSGMRSRRFGWYARVMGVRSVIVRDDRGLGSMMIESVDLDDRRLVLSGQHASVTISGYSTIRLELDADRTPRRMRTPHFAPRAPRTLTDLARNARCLNARQPLSIRPLGDNAGPGEGALAAPDELLGILAGFDQWPLDLHGEVLEFPRRTSDLVAVA